MNRRVSSPASSSTPNNKIIPWPVREDQPRTVQRPAPSWFRWSILLLTLLAVGWSSYYVWGTYQEWETAKAALVEAKDYQADAVEYNLLVQHEVNRLQTDDYLTELARRDYYYSKPDEIIFDLEEYQPVDNLFKSRDH